MASATYQWDHDKQEPAPRVIGQVAPKNRGETRNDPRSGGNDVALHDAVSFGLEPNGEEAGRHGRAAVKLEARKANAALDGCH